jgi:2-oxoglutarate ferredoxin oxidoreductase subunit alpha
VRGLSNNKVDLSIIIGGPQGGGIESAGQIAVRTLMLKGYDVYGTREYHSNITGAHSYFNLRARSDIARSVKLPVDFLIALDAESVFTHMDDVKKGGFFVYDSGTLNTKIDKIAPMSKALKARVKEKLSSLGLGDTVSDAIKYINNKGVNAVGIPIRELLKDVAKESGLSVVSVARVANTIGLAAGFALMGMEREHLEKAISMYFAGREKVIKPNVIATKISYDYIAKNYKIGESLPDGPYKGRVRMVVNGNDVVAIGKIAGGLTLQTYYPITPAADEALYMEGYRVVEPIEEVKKKLGLEKIGTVVIQTEDEISAIGMAIGAALAGARAATTTSGPGFSLMNEMVSMAVIMEAPVVITIWQRAGPSTGMATRSGQQDLLISMFSGHGYTPKIVLASGDHEEAFYDSIRALNWAEKFQTPVIHLVDKMLSGSLKSIDPPDPNRVKIERGKLIREVKGEYKRFKITDDGISPRAPLGVAKQMISSLVHDEYGMVTEDPVQRNEMAEKMLRKIETIEREIPENERYSLYGDPDADVLIVSWGTNKGPILDALERLNSEGIKAKFFQIRVFQPFPRKALLEAMDSSKIVIGVESNILEQMRLIVRMETLRDIPHMIVKYTGRTMYEQEIYFGVKEILEKGSRRVVVSDGA